VIYKMFFCMYVFMYIYRGKEHVYVHRTHAAAAADCERRQAVMRILRFEGTYIEV
jgi:hypothetical protein